MVILLYYWSIMVVFANGQWMVKHLNKNGKMVKHLNKNGKMVKHLNKNGKMMKHDKKITSTSLLDFSSSESWQKNQLECSNFVINSF